MCAHSTNEQHTVEAKLGDKFLPYWIVISLGHIPTIQERQKVMKLAQARVMVDYETAAAVINDDVKWLLFREG